MKKGKKCLIGIAASDSNCFKDNKNLTYRAKMVENDLIVPVFEIEAETAEELKQKVNTMIDNFFSVI